MPHADTGAYAHVCHAPAVTFSFQAGSPRFAVHRREVANRVPVVAGAFRGNPGHAGSCSSARPPGGMTVVGPATGCTRVAVRLHRTVRRYANPGCALPHAGDLTKKV